MQKTTWCVAQARFVSHTICIFPFLTLLAMAICQIETSFTNVQERGFCEAEESHGAYNGVNTTESKCKQRKREIFLSSMNVPKHFLFFFLPFEAFGSDFCPCLANAALNICFCIFKSKIFAKTC